MAERNLAVRLAVIDGGKVALRKIMDGIKCKPAKLNGRINKDTLIIRVVAS